MEHQGWVTKTRGLAISQSHNNVHVRHQGEPPIEAKFSSAQVPSSTLSLSHYLPKMSHITMNPLSD